MSADELRHVALPKLVGAPAYARPTVQVARIERPFDPDDLPLQAVMTDEERALLERGPVVPQPSAGDPSAGRLPARPFTLRALTDKLRGAGN
ncbi:MAG: hypothetical protein HY264_08225 [Chloroflexi bacterium]|nr:hypothetical protein [Chloroflexota bacterium]